jgi:tetratricopeptide (TPR) repeat protein
VTEADRAFLLSALLGAMLALVLVIGVVLFLVLRYRRVSLQSAADVRASIKAGDLEGARDRAEGWERRVKPKDVLQRVQLAGSWFAIGDHERALTTLSSTKYPPAWKGWSFRPLRRQADEIRYRSLLGLGKTMEADWCLNEVVDTDPGAPWLVEVLAEGARRSGDPRRVDAALDHARRFVETHPGDLYAGHALLTSALERGAFAEAAAALDEMVPKIEAKVRGARAVYRSDLSELRSLEGMVRLASGDEEGAEKAFAAALERDHGEVAIARVAKARADGLFNAHRFEEAADAYEQILSSADDGNALLALIECRRQLGTGGGVAPDLQGARSMGGDEKWAGLLEARLLADEGKGRDAERVALEAAGSDEPVDLTALYTLGYVRATNDLPGAEQTLRRWVVLFPERDDLDDVLDAPVLGGGTWRERISVEPRPDLSAS